MGDGICNFCLIRNIRARAKTKGLEVTVLPSPDDEEAGLKPPGNDVFMHPPGISVKLLEEDRPDDGPGDFWVCWVWTIPKKCEC